MMKRTFARMRRAVIDKSKLFTFNKEIYEEDVRSALKETIPIIETASFQPEKARVFSDITILGLPVSPASPEQHRDWLISQIKTVRPQAIAIHVDPAPLIWRHRNSIHKMKKEFELEESELYSPFPLFFNELQMNYHLLNALRDIETGIKYSPEEDIRIKPFFEEGLSDLGKIKELCDKYIFSGPDSYYYTENPQFRELFPYSVYSKTNVFLGKLPESLFRVWVGSRFSLPQLRAMLDTTLKEHRSLPLHQYFIQRYPEIGFLQHNIYFNALVRELTFNYKNVMAIAPLPFVKSLKQELTKVSQEKLSLLSDLFVIPESETKESFEDAVEKQALLDSLYSTKLWREECIENMFYYIDRNRSAFKIEDWNHYQTHFMLSFKGYQQYISENINS